MKVIKYKMCRIINEGEDIENKIFLPVTLDWNSKNEEIAKQEAYNGEYAIEDDGKAEPEVTAKSAEERIVELENTIQELRKLLGL